MNNVRIDTRYSLDFDKIFRNFCIDSSLIDM